MLKQETIDAFANFAGVEPQDLVEKIKSESEEDVTLQDVKVFTPIELETRLKNEKATSYIEGKDAGVEMLVKAKKKELGYEFDGRDLDSLFNYHSDKLKSGFGKPNEKITELENDIKKINSTHAEEITNWETKFATKETQLNQTLINNELLGIIPENTTLSKNDLTTLFNANFQVEKEDGKTIVKQYGVTLKDDKTAEPLKLNDVFMNFATERKYISGTGGRGGGNEAGSGGIITNSISQFQEKWKKQNDGKSTNSIEYQTAYSEWRKENIKVVA